MLPRSEGMLQGGLCMILVPLQRNKHLVRGARVQRDHQISTSIHEFQQSSHINGAPEICTDITRSESMCLAESLPRMCGIAYCRQGSKGDQVRMRAR